MTKYNIKDKESPPDVDLRGKNLEGKILAIAGKSAKFPLSKMCYTVIACNLKIFVITYYN